jgi:hypothetical protein
MILKASAGMIRNRGGVVERLDGLRGATECM